MAAALLPGEAGILAPPQAHVMPSGAHALGKLMVDNPARLYGFDG
jgi:hypothetical protein